jgi:hypothetical protein
MGRADMLAFVKDSEEQRFKMPALRDARSSSSVAARRWAESIPRSTAIVHAAAEEAGRDPTALGMEGRISLGSGSSSSIEQQVAARRQAGATHLSINTMRAAFSTVDEHIAALTSASEAVLN